MGGRTAVLWTEEHESGVLRFGWRASGIVRRFHVRDCKRPFAVDLNDRGAAGDREVMRILRSRDEAAGREPLGAAHVHAVAHAHEEDAGEDGDLLIGGMEMRLDDVAGGEAEPDRVHAGLAGIAWEHRETGVRGQKGGARAPLHGSLGVY